MINPRSVAITASWQVSQMPSRNNGNLTITSENSNLYVIDRAIDIGLRDRYGGVKSSHDALAFMARRSVNLAHQMSRHRTCILVIAQYFDT
jgi:hypothetical protein